MLLCYKTLSNIDHIKKYTVLLFLFSLHLSDRVLISFEEFYGALKDPDFNKSNPAGPLTIPQTLALLRGPARGR